MTLTPRLLRLALHCAQQELDSRAGGAGPRVQSWNAELVRALELELATMSRSGHRFDDETAASDSWLTAQQVASRLGLSKRQVTRLAGALDGELIAGRWLFPDTAVAEYKRTRGGGERGAC
ncbi:hypothetical protein [Mycolicibacterium sp. HK-90]|uniref:hypothetical protein n=1 Tax=Mycolicibacterium sp. HK-90 TaxID=3056937 RepID=UPI00265B2DF0|nr:hypothetical protein [Mycolicibacterium sp. HK-90]WKG03062.1 hypothetical protein QU592_28400 [Mycolicibacterium sp. HK-90]